MATYDTIIRNGAVVRETGVERADVAIVEGKLVEIGPQLHGDARETIDASGLHVFPGVIDPHVHFNEPGRTEWEGIATGSSALAAGGGTCFFDMPLNSSPPVLDGGSFDLKLAAAKAKSVTDFALWGGLTPNNLDKLEELAHRGVIGFKAFMCDSGIDDFHAADVETLRRGMETAEKLGLPVAVHAEDPQVIARATERACREGRSVAQYCASHPIEAEVAAIRTAIGLARETGCKFHIVHVSSPEGVLAVMSANGADVTCETCPHYLAFTDRDLVAVGAALKCAPALHGDDDRRRMWNYLSSAMIHFVASDHSPAPPSMKCGEDFFRIWGGVGGVQSTLAVLLNERNELLKIPLEWIARMTSLAAARRFRIASKGQIEPGVDADAALVDLSARYTLTRDDLLDRHKLSPYVGRTFTSRVRRTLVRGTTVFLDGRIVSEPIGRLVKPA